MVDRHGGNYVSNNDRINGRSRGDYHNDNNLYDNRNNEIGDNELMIMT